MKKQYGLYQKDRVDDLAKQETFNIWEDENKVLNSDTVEFPAGSDVLLDNDCYQIIENELSSPTGDVGLENAFVADLSGRAKFDKYYDARVAMNKRTLRTLSDLIIASK